MPGAKRASLREDAAWEEEGLPSDEQVGASAATIASMVGASTTDDPAELFFNGLPHCEQNRAARSTSEPHCGHRSICNGSHNPLAMLPRPESLEACRRSQQSGELCDNQSTATRQSSSECLMHGIFLAKSGSATREGPLRLHAARASALQKGSVVRLDQYPVDWTHGAQKNGQRRNRCR